MQKLIRFIGAATITGMTVLTISSSAIAHDTGNSQQGAAPYGYGYPPPYYRGGRSWGGNDFGDGRASGRGWGESSGDAAGSGDFTMSMSGRGNANQNMRGDGMSDFSGGDGGYGGGYPGGGWGAPPYPYYGYPQQATPPAPPAQ